MKYNVTNAKTRESYKTYSNEEDAKNGVKLLNTYDKKVTAQLELIFTENEFEEKFDSELIQNTITNREEFSGYYFETFGEDRKFIRSLPSNRVITILENDKSELYYESGCDGYDDVFGYLVLANPYEGLPFTVELDKD